MINIKKGLFFTALTCALLSGCQKSVEPIRQISGHDASSPVVMETDSTSQPSTDTGHGPLFVIDIPEVGLHVPYWAERIASGGVNDGVLDPARKGDYEYVLTSHNNTSGPNAFVYGIQYDRPSDGFADWSMPLSVATALRKRIDQTSCTLLITDEVYVPVNMQRPHLCKATVTSNDSLPVIVVVGIGHPYEEGDSPESMVILFDEDRAIIISDLVEFPATMNEMQMLIDEHMRDYPATEWPNELFVLLTEKMSSFLEEKFLSPTAELKDNLNLLLSVGQGMWVD